MGWIVSLVGLETLVGVFGGIDGLFLWSFGVLGVLGDIDVLFLWSCCVTDVGIIPILLTSSTSPS